MRMFYVVEDLIGTGSSEGDIPPILRTITMCEQPTGIFSGGVQIFWFMIGIDFAV